jgi:hypothetical protein
VLGLLNGIVGLLGVGIVVFVLNWVIDYAMNA